MLAWFFEYLTRFISGFNVFNYITMRAIMGALTALIISLVFGPIMIRRLHVRQIGETVREDGPDTHLLKAGTPTMGGALILTAILASTLLWADLGNRYVWIVAGVTLAFGLIGFVDDYRKLILQDPAPEVYFVGFGDSTLDLQLRVFINIDEVEWRWMTEVHQAIDDAFAKHDIEIAFPQRDVNLKITDSLSKHLQGRSGAESSQTGPAV